MAGGPRLRAVFNVAVLVALLPATSLGSRAQESPVAPSMNFVTDTALSPATIGQLELAWASSLGFDGRAVGPPAYEHGVLYVSTSTGVSAFDASGGERLWSFDDPAPAVGSSSLRRAPRGAPIVRDDVVVVALPSRAAVAAVDAGSGEARWIRDVGDRDLGAVLSSNPTLAGDVAIVGPTGADLAPLAGRLTALDLVTGEAVWSTDLVPIDEGDPARSTWGPMAPSPSFGIGGGTAWNLGSYDERHGLVVFGTGQPIPADRLDPRRFEEDDVTADLYTASFVALDVTTGEIAWFHQVVPGDEWEYDQHTVPIVTRLEVDGVDRDVALLATTTGFIVLVDVATGELLRHHLMTPFSTVHLGYEPDGTSVIDASARRSSNDETIRVCPGARWASVAPGAYNPNSGLVYRPNEWGCVRRGATQAPDEWVPGTRALWLQSDARSVDDFFERWGGLSAIDPVIGEVVWEFVTPYRHDAGVVTTATGLVISAFADRTLRIFDAATGDVLWDYVLPAHSDGTPLLFDVDGKPHLAILVGRDVGVPALPESGLPPSVAGPASLFVFRVP